MWSSHYVMEQRYDLALDAGLILFESEMYEDAKHFLEISIEQEQDEVVSTVFYCLAICCFELDLDEDALRYLWKLIELEPDHEEALAMLGHFELS